MPSPLAQLKYGAELGSPGDEYNKSPFREGRPRLLEDKTHRPTTPSGILPDAILPQEPLAREIGKEPA